VHYSVSGRVIKEEGEPVAALVEIDYSPTPGRLPWVQARTDRTGRYELDFDATRPLQSISFTAAVGLIYTIASDYDTALQILPWGPTTIVKDLVVERSRTITAGGSTRVAVHDNSAICWDLEDYFLPTRRCARLRVTAPANGTLVFDARPVEDADAVPFVFLQSSGPYRQQIHAPGKATILEVRAGMTYHFFVGAPAGITKQQFDVTTSLQPEQHPPPIFFRNYSTTSRR
jgi:hypothetical protein